MWRRWEPSTWCLCVFWFHLIITRNILNFAVLFSSMIWVRYVPKRILWILKVKATNMLYKESLYDQYNKFASLIGVLQIVQNNNLAVKKTFPMKFSSFNCIKYFRQQNMASISIKEYNSISIKIWITYKLMSFNHF